MFVCHGDGGDPPSHSFSVGETVRATHTSSPGVPILLFYDVSEHIMPCLQLRILPNHSSLTRSKSHSGSPLISPECRAPVLLVLLSPPPFPHPTELSTDSECGFGSAKQIRGSLPHLHWTNLRSIAISNPENWEGESDESKLDLPCDDCKLSQVIVVGACCYVADRFTNPAIRTVENVQEPWFTGSRARFSQLAQTVWIYGLHPVPPPIRAERRPSPLPQSS